MDGQLAAAASAEGKSEELKQSVRKAIAMRSNKILISLIITSLLIIPGRELYGQRGEKITLDEIFLEQKFVAAPAGITDWTPDGKGNIVMTPGRERVAVKDAATGREETIIDMGDLTKSSGPELRLSQFFLSDDGKMIVIEAVGRREGERHYSYFFKRCGGDEYTMVNGEGHGKRVMNLQFSPDNRYISYVYRSDIYIYDTVTGKGERLTTDGSQQVANAGSSEKIAPVLNMMGYRWSPDSRKIAYTRLDSRDVGIFRMINNTDSVYSRVTGFRHVKPGTTLPQVRLMVKDIADRSEKVIWQGPEERFSYVTWYGWTGRDELLVRLMNRNQNDLQISSNNVVTGRRRVVWEDRDEAFLMPFEMIFTKGKKSFLALSEKESWRYLYLVETKSGKERALTSGDFDVESIAGFDREKETVYFIASPESAIHRYLYKVSLKEGSRPVKVSPDRRGVHTYDIAPGAQYAFHTFSTMATPPVTSLIKLSDHSVLRTLQDNQALNERLKEKELSKPHFIKIDIGDGIQLDAWWIKPPDFDSLKKYPLITHVYSMPGNAVVRDHWLHNNYMWYQLMAQKGFIVMNIDSRGTPSLYGRDWRKVIYLKHGLIPSDEQAMAVKKMTTDYPFIDSRRVGIFGWSGGGLVSLLQILRYPDIYQVAIPGAYISNHRNYHAGFTERFLGLPQDNPEAYDLTAAMNYAGGLKGDLLLIHGTGDDNVHYQNTEVMIKRLVEEKKRFFVIPYPNITHNVKADRATYFHLFDMYTWFFSSRLSGDITRMNE